MSEYKRTNWLDHVVDAETEEIIQQGTPISAKNLNNIEVGVENASKKIGLFIGDTLPAIEEREEKTLYFKVTDTISTSGTDNIQVSPTMGIKIV